VERHRRKMELIEQERKLLLDNKEIKIMSRNASAQSLATVAAAVPIPNSSVQVSSTIDVP